MNDDEWVAAALDLSRQQTSLKHVEFESLRVALARTSSLMATAPTRFSNAYSLLPEAELVRGGEAVHDELDQDRWEWDIDLSSPLAAAKDVGARARGLDTALAHVAPYDGPPDDVDRAYFCADADAYVVPRPRGAGELRGHGARLFFRRRGTPLHRIVPKRVGSFTTVLHALDDLEVGTSSRSLGAAMFADFELQTERIGDAFTAMGIVCPDATKAIHGHVDAGRSRCTSIVWPELTMPDEQLEALIDKLSTDALGAGPGGALRWVMAGSWHRGDPMVNSTPILDSYGNRRFDCVKSILYRDAEHGIEHAAEGYVVPILVTERSLVAFGICRDFCELAQDTPYSELGVDLVIVPSMGDDATIRSHRTVAHRIAIAGERAFVVQQRQITGGDDTGWVLPPVRDPSRLELHDMVASAWSEHRWDRDD